MGVRAGQGYGVAKPKRLTCPSCGKKGVSQWKATPGGLVRSCQFCQAAWGEAGWEVARASMPASNVKPLTEMQQSLLAQLGHAVGVLRPRSSQNMTAKGLELRGLITRSDFGDCRITDSGRAHLANNQPK